MDNILFQNYRSRIINYYEFIEPTPQLIFFLINVVTSCILSPPELLIDQATLIKSLNPNEIYNVGDLLLVILNQGMCRIIHNDKWLCQWGLRFAKSFPGFSTLNKTDCEYNTYIIVLHIHNAQQR